MDILDVLTPNKYYSCPGTYWKELPESAHDFNGSQPFTYSYVDPQSYTYKRIFSNIQTNDASEIAIRTNTEINFNNDSNGYIMTSNNELYRIVEIQKDYAKTPKEALRFLGTPINTEYFMRAVKIQNPWAIT